MKRFVVDPNVLIAGLGGSGPGSPPALLIGAVRDRQIEIVACATLLEEVRRGLRKPYFRARLSETEAQWGLLAIERVAVVVDDPVEIDALLRDATDDYLVALAKDTGSEAIISGDRDLLEHVGLRPPAIDPRRACGQIGLLSRSDPD